MSIVAELGKLAELKREGLLSDEQFELAKDQVLASAAGSGDGSAGIAAAPSAPPAAAPPAAAP
eukprot:COSAG04_NODE_3790_length_2528_cov_2.647180_1_plen_62_part_10